MSNQAIKKCINCGRSDCEGYDFTDDEIEIEEVQCCNCAGLSFDKKCSGCREDCTADMADTLRKANKEKNLKLNWDRKGKLFNSLLKK